jgi:O-antigen ligase
MLARSRKQNMRFRPVFISLILLIFLFLGLSYSLNKTQWGIDFSERLEDRTGAGRTNIWRSGFNHIAQRPFYLNIFGEGEGAFASAMIKQMGFSVGAHSGWLSLFVAYGIIGLFLYIQFFRRLFKITFFSFHLRNSSSFEILSSIIAGILVAETTQGFLLSPSSVPIYTMLGFQLAHMAKAKKYSHAYNKNIFRHR